MKSPATPMRFIALALAFWLLILAASATADMLYLWTPHDPLADSPGVALMQLQELALALAKMSPVFALLVWFVWRRYSGARPLFSFSRTRPFLSSTLWLVFGGLATLSLTGVLFVRRVPDIPWGVYRLLAAYFFLSCNASLLATYGRHAKA